MADVRTLGRQGLDNCLGSTEGLGQCNKASLTSALTKQPVLAVRFCMVTSPKYIAAGRVLFVNEERGCG